MVQKHGSIKLALAGLRHYWKLIIGTAGVLVGCGIFLNKFDTLIEGQKTAIQEFKALHAEQAAVKAEVVAVKSEVSAVKGKQDSLESRWNTLFDAAHITVTPNTPAPPPPSNAPPRARQGSITR